MNHLPRDIKIHINPSAKEILGQNEKIQASTGVRGQVLYGLNDEVMISIRQHLGKNIANK